MKEMLVLFSQQVKFDKLKISQTVVLKGATCEKWPLPFSRDLYYERYYETGQAEASWLAY